jgi:hypothetical protein
MPFYTMFGLCFFSIPPAKLGRVHGPSMVGHGLRPHGWVRAGGVAAIVAMGLPMGQTPLGGHSSALLVL